MKLSIMKLLIRLLREFAQPEPEKLPEKSRRKFKRSGHPCARGARRIDPTQSIFQQIRDL